MKTIIPSDLVHVALIVSLLRFFPELYNNPRWDSEPLVREVRLGASSAYTQTNFHNVYNGLDGYINSKNVDNLLSRSLFLHDLRAFTRSSRHHRNDIYYQQNNIITYIVNSQHQTLPSRTNSSTVSSEEGLHQSNSSSGRPAIEESISDSDTSGSDLTQEDMDLIEILWKQDIDLGISREVFDGTWSNVQELQKPAEKTVKKEPENGTEQEQPQEAMASPDPWQGLQYTIDSETGEHIIHNPPCQSEEPSSIQLPPGALQNICLEEALQLFEGNTYHLIPPVHQTLNPHLDGENQNEVMIADNSRFLLEQLNELERLSLEARNDTVPPPGVMEMGWSPPPSALAEMEMPHTSAGFIYDPEPMNVSDSHLFQANNSLEGVLLRNTTLPSIDHSANYSSAVTDFQMQPVDDRQFLEFLEMLSNGSDPDIGSMGTATNEQISDFFGTNLTNGVSDYLSQLLADEGLDLMDFSTLPEESEMNATTKEEVRNHEVSDDSAVSCMSSESPRSDPDWIDSGSEASHSGDADSEQSSYSSHTRESKKTRQMKQRRENASSLPNLLSNTSNDNLDCSDVSEKTGRRLPSSRTLKTDSESSETFFHNHTYHLPPTDGSSVQKLVERDKKSQWEFLEHCSRDDRRAKALKIPFATKDIINLSIEEFNELLAKHDLTEAQLTLIRDIRRRGKNKVAAQNCRKRKLNQIFDLQLELDDLQLDKTEIEVENRELMDHHQLLKEKYDRLYQFVFQSPGPPDPHGFNLHQAGQEDQRSMFHAGANSTNQDRSKDSKSGTRMKRKQDKK